MYISILERRKMKAAALTLVLTAPIAGFEAVSKAAITSPGDLVVEQVGNGAAALTNASTAVFLDIYTPVVDPVTGAVTLTPESTPQIALPSLASSNGLASNPLTTSGSASSEGELSISADGNTIAVAGYMSNAGVTGIASSNSTTVPREVALVSPATGAIDTSTTTTGFNGNNIRSAVLVNSTTIYAAGAAAPGLSQLTVDAVNGAGTQVENTVTNLRTVQIYNGAVYVTDSTGSVVNVAAVSGGTATQLPGLSVSNNSTQNTTGSKIFSPYEIAFANGGTTLYVVDQGGNGNNGSGIGAIEKFDLFSGAWAPEGYVPIGNNSATGLTAETLSGPNGAFTALFATTPTEIYEISDTSASLTGDPLNAVQPVGTNEAFRGIVAVPEPTVMSGMLLAGTAALLRRRRRFTSNANQAG